MLSISKDQVPLFLHETAFYHGLEEGDGQRFEVPNHCYKVDFTLKTEADVTALIDTIRFWGMGSTPKELVAYAMKKGYFHCRSLFRGAEDDLRYLKVLSELQMTIRERQIKVAMESGNLTILQYLFENGHVWRPDSMKYAAKEGHLECMKYARENGCSWGNVTMAYIARGGHLECMKYAHKNGCRWAYTTIAHIAGSGHVDCLKYAVANGCPKETSAYWHTDDDSILEDTIYFGGAYLYGACANAGNKGQLEMLKYLHDNNLAVWDHNTCAAAAASGQLECLKFAHENGCAWNANTTALAARYWHFHCLDYALQNGCAYDTRAIFYMSIADHPDTRRLLRATCRNRPILILKTALAFWCIVEEWVILRVMLPAGIVIHIMLMFMFFYSYVMLMCVLITSLSAELEAML